jgi:hypothetical protein
LLTGTGNYCKKTARKQGKPGEKGNHKSRYAGEVNRG